MNTAKNFKLKNKQKTQAKTKYFSNINNSEKHYLFWRMRLHNPKNLSWLIGQLPSVRLSEKFELNNLLRMDILIIDEIQCNHLRKQIEKNKTYQKILRYLTLDQLGIAYPPIRFHTEPLFDKVEIIEEIKNEKLKVKNNIISRLLNKLNII